MIFKARSRMMDIKCNMKGNHLDLKCDVCGIDEETQIHLLRCTDIENTK